MNKRGAWPSVGSKQPPAGQTLFGDSAVRVARTRHSASPGCPGFALIGEKKYDEIFFL